MTTPFWAWCALVGAIVGLLLFDLLVVHRRAHEVSVREAGVFTAVWCSIGLGFGGLLWWWQGGEVAAQYAAGYVVEWSLSLDNVFVFALLFAAFFVPVELRYRVLFWGIVLAIFLRAIFIFAGASLLENVHWVAYVFGAFLVATGLRVARKREHGSALGENKVLLLLQRRLPVTPDFDGARFWTQVDGRRTATPLAAALLAIAAFDVLFAVDSIPAVLAITTEPFIVFAANAFALLGLRSLFFLVIGSLTRIRYLNAGLGAILVLVGTKMLIADWWKMPIWVSLPAIIGILAVTVLVSLRVGPPTRRPAPRPLAPEGGR